MLWCSLPSHRELFATDNILSDEFDSDKVYEELNEDEEFDLQDKKLSADYELSLWNKGWIHISCNSLFILVLSCVAPLTQ